MRKILAILSVALMLVLPAAARADWLGSQQGPVPICLAFSFTGVPTASEQHSARMPIAFKVPANTGAVLTGFTSGCNFKTAATGSAAFLVKDCDTSGSCTTKATFTIAGSARTCTFSTQATFTVAQDHLLAVFAPSSPDATLADGSVTVCGTR